MAYNHNPSLISTSLYLFLEMPYQLKLNHVDVLRTVLIILYEQEANSSSSHQLTNYSLLCKDHLALY